MTREEEIGLRDDISRLKRRVSILERDKENSERQNRLNRFGAYWTDQEIAEAFVVE